MICVVPTDAEARSSLRTEGTLRILPLSWVSVCLGALPQIWASAIQCLAEDVSPFRPQSALERARTGRWRSRDVASPQHAVGLHSLFGTYRQSGRLSFHLHG